MTKEHIIEILDNTPMANLTESEMKMIRAHAEGCANCQRAFEAAQISAVLIEERAAAAIEPSPFFQTRVLAALRERQANVPALVRLWKSAGALVTSMAATTVALAALTFLVPGPVTVQPETTAALVPYSAEAVILEQNQGDDQVTDDQVFNTIYANDDEDR